MSKDLNRILAATFVSWTGLRLTEVALPLIALAQTGSVWATGLVAGCSGIALVTSPWWAVRIRQRVTSGRALAAVLSVQAFGHLIVAVFAFLDRLSLVHLCVSGLVAGGAAAVGGPATRAAIADLGDQLGPKVAVRGLAWQDLAHRISLVSGPPVAAWVVTQYGALPLMVADSTAVALGALIVLPVARFAKRGDPAAGPIRSVRAVLRSHPLVADGIVMAGVGWFWWFAFALGLAILGVQIGEPGTLVAAGLAGYGVGSLAGSAVAALVIGRLPRMPAIMVAWMTLGVVFVTLPSVASSWLLLIAVSAVAGLVSPFGITALNALITEQTNGADRRTAFAAQQVAGTGGASLGMLSGGAVIGLLGTSATMRLAGVVLMALPMVFLLRARMLNRSGERPDDDAQDSPVVHAHA